MSANATFHPYPLLACSFPCLAPCSSIRKAFITNLTQKLAILKMCLVMRNAHCHLKKVHGFLLYLFLFFVFSCISRSLSHTFCQSCVVHYCITFRRLSVHIWNETFPVLNIYLCWRIGVLSAYQNA